jgi:hypothetical protein
MSCLRWFGDVLDPRVGLEQLVKGQDVLPTEWWASAWLLGVRAVAARSRCVVLRDRVTAEPVVEQGDSDRDGAEQVRHLAPGGDKAAAAAQASPGQPAKRPKELS